MKYKYTIMIMGEIGVTNLLRYVLRKITLI